MEKQKREDTETAKKEKENEAKRKRCESDAQAEKDDHNVVADDNHGEGHGGSYNCDGKDEESLRRSEIDIDIFAARAGKLSLRLSEAAMEDIIRRYQTAPLGTSTSTITDQEPDHREAAKDEDEKGKKEDRSQQPASRGDMKEEKGEEEMQCDGMKSAEEADADDNGVDPEYGGQ